MGDLLGSEVARDFNRYSLQLIIDPFQSFEGWESGGNEELLHQLNRAQEIKLKLSRFFFGEGIEGIVKALARALESEHNSLGSLNLGVD